MSPARRRLIAAISAAIVSVSLPTEASAQDVPPAPSEAELAASIRNLEPVVRVLQPVVRRLRTETRKGDRRVVTISTDVLFEFDSAELTVPAKRIVADLAREIAATKGDVTIVGHTDSIGTEAYNQDLSERRAAAVADALQPAIGADRTLTVTGRGERDPVAPNEKNGRDNPAGRALNRRVVVSFSAR